MSRSKNVACLPLCSSFVSNSQGYMHLKDFENSPTSLLVQNKVIYESTSSMVFISSCCFFRNKSLNMLRLKNDKKKQIFPDRRVNTHRHSNILFEHHVSNSKITIFEQENSCLNKTFSIKYFLSRPLKVQYLEAADYPVLL